MKRKQKRGKKTQESPEQRWEEASAIFENPKRFEELAKGSRVLSASEQRAMLGPGKTKQTSIRLPEEDLAAVKEIAEASERPYQQLVVVAVQQYIDRLANTFKHK